MRELFERRGLKHTKKMHLYVHKADFGKINWVWGLHFIWKYKRWLKKKCLSVFSCFLGDLNRTNYFHFLWAFAVGQNNLD